MPRKPKIDKTCPQCNKTFRVSYKGRFAKHCSQNCAHKAPKSEKWKAAMLNNLAYTRTPEIRKAQSERRKTYFLTERGKKDKQNMHNRMLGELNPAKKEEVRARIQRTTKKSMQAFTGDNNPARRPEVRAKISAKKKGDTHTEESKRKMSVSQVKRLLSGDFQYKGFFTSKKNKKDIGFRSRYEYGAMLKLEENDYVVKYDYESFSVPYIDEEGLHRNTIPDFLAYYGDGTKEIIEVKPQFKIDKNFDNTLLKLEAIKAYAANNGMRFCVWTEEFLDLERVDMLRALWQ